MTQKTHVLVNEPEISVRYLADYMAGSERARRSIIVNAKYRPIARMIQHKEARAVLANSIVSDAMTAQLLMEKSDYIRQKLADDDFDISVNDANADYLQRVSQIIGEFSLPKATVSVTHKKQSINMQGVKLRFSPHVILDRPGKKNVTKRGALMFRYAKNKPLSASVAKYQSAAIYGLLSDAYKESSADEAEKAICLTADMFTGKLQCAMGDAVTDYKNMQAALQSIAERWPAVKAPDGAVV